MKCARRLLAVVCLSGCATAPHRAAAPAIEASSSGAVESGDEGDPDAAAESLSARVTAPAPPPRAFTELQALRRRVSATERERLAQLGSSPERPVYVLSPEYEYSWVGAFACVEGHPRVTHQALLKGRRGDLDALEFDCGEGPTRAIYFDSGGH